jgi:hypothetical protein
MAETRTGETETGETEAMTAGRELDRRVAEALGWEKFRDAPEAYNGRLLTDLWRRKRGNGEWEFCREPPHYSTDEGDAVRALDGYYHVRMTKYGTHDKRAGWLHGVGVWSVSVIVPDADGPGCQWNTGEAETLPLAVCGAILQAAAKEQQA